MTRAINRAGGIEKGWGDKHSILTPIVLNWFRKPDRTLYELDLHLKEVYGGMTEIAFGSLRNVVDRLEKADYLVRGKDKLILVATDNGRDGRREVRHTYLLTEHGKALLCYWKEFIVRLGR